MQRSNSIFAVALLGVILAACGGGGPTQGPGGPGGGTQGPGATQSGGGGGGGGGGGSGGGPKPAGWDQYGKASYEISAPISLSGEMGFVPAASRFDQAGATSLSFTIDGTDEVLTFLIVQGQSTMTYGGPNATVVGATCTTSNLSIQATSAKGSFDCPSSSAFLASGASVANVSIKGSFDVHG